MFCYIGRHTGYASADIDRYSCDWIISVDQYIGLGSILNGIMYAAIKYIFKTPLTGFSF